MINGIWYIPEITSQLDITGKKSYFDNENWIKSVLYSHPESIESARDYLTISGLNTFIQFLRHLEDKGWL